MLDSSRMFERAVGAGTTHDAVHSAVGHLESLITAVPPDARRDKALYHLERLRMAFQSSHQEAVRFAAFTVNKIVHDGESEWGVAVSTAMDALRESLHRAGHEF